MTVTLDTLVNELRLNSDSDRDFARRVALVCATLADASYLRDDQDAGASIRTCFDL